MEDYLTCIAIAVQDKAETSLCDSLPLSDDVRNMGKMAEKMMVLLRNVKERRNMLSGNYDSMDRSLGVDIVESERCLILVDD